MEIKQQLVGYVSMWVCSMWIVLLCTNRYMGEGEEMKRNKEPAKQENETRNHLRSTLSLYLRRSDTSKRNALHGSSSAGVTSERSTSALSLDAAEALQFLGLHRDPATESNLACCPLNEGDTVRVQGFVDRGSARLCAAERNTLGVGVGGLLGNATSVERLDDRGLHGELDPVQRNEPDNILRKQQVKP
jgi:hypothetical protein